MQNKKIILGQFYTTCQGWLFPHVVEFIKQSGCSVAYDPFAGNGDLINAAVELGFNKVIGLDIDASLKWIYNDSLKNIPHVDGAIIITNPPYLSNYSASRKKIYDTVKEYFDGSFYSDLYLIALEKMVLAQDYVVAIVPETFINSNFAYKNLLKSITIIEKGLFDDTSEPVAVLCFDGVEKDEKQISVYKNDVCVGDFYTINALRLVPKNNVSISFNDSDGWLAVRCVDTTDDNNKIRFGFKQDFKYDWDERIKISSRLLTVVNVCVADSDRIRFINECNSILHEFRKDTCDVVLSPFKGNMKSGSRRRRLDFKTCRAIIESAYFRIYGEKGKGNMNNFDYYNYSKEHFEDLFDAFYAKNKVIIPDDSSQDNLLTSRNAQLIDNITAFKVLRNGGFGEDNEAVKSVVDKVVEILSTTPNINYSAFSQFFMVYNQTYESFKRLSKSDKFAFVYKMLELYCEQRHDLYLNHGYSDVVLQVLCDNYSHKRKSKTTIEKVLSMLGPYGVRKLKDIAEADSDDYYLLPDKGDKKLFDEYLKKYDIKMESRNIEQNKYPDLLFKHGGHVYICELKSIKGCGGGQDKQMVEIAYFIKFSEKSDVHYLAFLDCDYANILFSGKKPKVVKQREDIENALLENPKNYFVNTAGFSKLLNDAFSG